MPRPPNSQRRQPVSAKSEPGHMPAGRAGVNNRRDLGKGGLLRHSVVSHVGNAHLTWQPTAVDVWPCRHLNLKDDCVTVGDRENLEVGARSRIEPGADHLRQLISRSFDTLGR